MSARRRTTGRRLEGTGEDVGRSLGRLVVTLLDIVRQVVERQALRRVDAGDLTDEQVERLGRALMQLEDTFDELIEHFGVTPNDKYLPLNLDALAGLADAGPVVRTDPHPPIHPPPRRTS